MRAGDPVREEEHHDEKLHERARRVGNGDLCLPALEDAAGAQNAQQLEQPQEADDAEDHKAATIALILSYEKPAKDPSAALREELGGLKPSALKKRARAAGLREEDIEEADDAEDSKAAMIELIVAQPADADGTAQAKTKPDTEAASAPAKADPLRAELNGLRLKALRSRAEAEGVDDDLLEDAVDSDNPRQEVIELLLQRHESTKASEDALRQELSSLRLKEIRARARQAGVGADELEGATDSDDPKQAAIELVLRASSRANAG